MTKTERFNQDIKAHVQKVQRLCDEAGIEYAIFFGLPEEAGAGLADVIDLKAPQTEPPKAPPKREELSEDARVPYLMVRRILTSLLARGDLLRSTLACIEEARSLTDAQRALMCGIYPQTGNRPTKMRSLRANLLQLNAIMDDVHKILTELSGT